MNPFVEQEAWEEHQIGKATLKFGSKNKKQTADDYQFVFEDQIEFIKASVMDGDKFDNELSTESPETSKANSIIPSSFRLIYQFLFPLLHTSSFNEFTFPFYYLGFHRNSDLGVG